MENKLNLNDKLNFDDIDFTAPEIVIKEILSELPKETNDIVYGKIEGYEGEVESYTTTGIPDLKFSLGKREVNIQQKLGKIGNDIKKFECSIYTPVYDKFSYRVFFIKYSTSNYPVQVTLEQSVAGSLPGGNSSIYIYICDNRNELEELMIAIFTSKKMVEVMQELIRIHQSKKDAEVEPAEEETE